MKDQWDCVVNVLEVLGKKIVPEISIQYWYLLFCSSSCWQACFPTIIRPINYLWKLILKKIPDRQELNCSVVFSLYCLRKSKKIDHFLRNLVRRERRFSWFNINPLSFIHRNDAWYINKFSSLWFCFRLWSGCKTLRNRLWRFFFK